MFRTVVLSSCAVLVLAMSPAAVAEKVALRAANGRFLRTADDGVLRAESFFPLDKETFELVCAGPLPARRAGRLPCKGRVVDTSCLIPATGTRLA